MAHSEQAEHGGHEEHEEHGSGFYVKIWGILCVLLVISVLGPMLEIKIVTLMTAFGIAVVKAYLVARNFMHLAIEKKYIVYLLCTALAFMFLFYAGTSPDVMQHSGRLWQNVSAEAEVERALKSGGASHGGDAHGHGAPHGEPGHEQPAGGGHEH